ncbi:MAG: hypothetical protein KDA88_07230 [Planctomycetaceae bacterium]|nr:hypothetical protein [Planctomycetaceae bacterium]MCB9953928.1 hypothetical protein [Planctomycetaceae bacterium]
MTINIKCPECSSAYEVPDDKAGKKFRCKSCQAIVEIPGGDTFGPSNDPFAGGSRKFRSDDDDDDDDDYGPPRRSRSRSGGSRRRRHARISSGSPSGTAPGIAMMIVAGMGLLVFVLLAITSIGQGGPNPNDLPPPGPERDSYMVGYYVGSCGFPVFGLISQILIIFGGWNLMAGKSRTMAYIAAVLCCIPCCCSPVFILGVPFGIWALVAINQMTQDGAFES